MAKFLTTVGNSYFIEQIVLNAESSLTIVTPYLKISQTLLDRLRDADRSGIKISLIYGKNELLEKEKKSLYELGNLEIFFCQNLHAKCYHNENELVISSMNLHEFSEKNNREMGILIERTNDVDIFRETLKEIESIKNASNKQKSFSEKNDISQCNNEGFQLIPEYMEPWNFHLPSVHKMLLEIYPDSKIIFDDSIKILNFPKEKINIEIAGRIDFKFDKSINYKQIEILNKDRLHSELPEVRFFWNRPMINIYLKSNFKDEISLSGVERKTKKFIDIISTVSKKLEL